MDSRSIRQFMSQDGPPIQVMPAFHTSISRHSHSFFELVYVMDGFCLHSVDDRTALLMEGDFFLLHPGQSHSYAGERIVNIYNCLFEESEIPPSLKTLAAFSPDAVGLYHSMHLDLEERKTISRHLASMVSELQNHPLGWETKLRAHLSMLLVEYARCWEKHLAQSDEKQSFIGYVTPALAHIDQHYAQRLTVRDIAASVGVSPDYLTRQFHKVTGITPQEYLRRFRFARAMELLQAGLPVGEVAARVGFSNLCHFSREFKKEMGVTPSQYKP